MKNINILDCTLRDGGYYNEWYFSEAFINDYLKFISLSGIEFVELGFSQFKKNKTKGYCYNVDNILINKLKIPQNLKIGLMINASDIIKNIDTSKAFKKFLLNKKKISLIRIACHFYEVNKIIPILKVLKKVKIKIAINLMQISEQKTIYISKTLKKISKEKVDIFYFADSLGCMFPKQVKEIIHLIKKNSKAQIGFHAHDNSAKAKSNTLTAIANGSDWIDVTVLGMGRGAGNAKTEDFIKRNKLQFINKLKKKRFFNLKNKYKWGYNKYYHLSAKYKIHPTYIQQILKISKITDKKIMNLIKGLKGKNSNYFNSKRLNTVLLENSIKI